MMRSRQIIELIKICNKSQRVVIYHISQRIENKFKLKKIFIDFKFFDWNS